MLLSSLPINNVGDLKAILGVGVDAPDEMPVQVTKTSLLLEDYLGTADENDAFASSEGRIPNGFTQDISPFISVTQDGNKLDIEILHFSLAPFASAKGVESIDDLDDEDIPFPVEDAFFAPTEYYLQVVPVGEKLSEDFPEGSMNFLAMVGNITYQVQVLYHSF